MYCRLGNKGDDVSTSANPAKKRWQLPTSHS